MRNQFQALVQDGAKYGVVGVLGTILDILFFNLFLLAVLEFFATTEPISAKVFSTVLSSFATYLLHGHWTFADRGGSRKSIQTISSFGIVTVLGLAVSVGVVGLAHYVAGLQSIAENNIANLVALAISALLRFFLTRHWVFKGERHPPANPYRVSRKIARKLSDE